MNRINSNCLKQLYLISNSLFNQLFDAVQISLIKLKHWVMWKSDLEKSFKYYFLYEYQGHIWRVIYERSIWLNTIKSTMIHSCWNVWQWQFKTEEMKAWNRKNIASIRILIKDIDSHVIESQVNNWKKKKKSMT